MNCATHSDIAAVAFCRSCGKPLCANCTRDVRGVVYCEPCLAARLEGATPAAGFVPPQAAYPQTVYPPAGSPVPPAPPSGSGPNPAVAGILAGFFPLGVGAVYCSQYAKGLAHLLIFVLLVAGWSHGGNLWWIFFLGLGFFYVYQIIDAVRTAKALQMGEPAPDPMGLAQTFSLGEKFDAGKVPAGAVVLIALGVLFFLHTMEVLQFSGEFFIGLLLILLGGWTLAKHWGLSRTYARVCSCAQCRMRNLMGPAILFTIGAILLLDSRDIASLGWERTWPAILLVIGLVKLVQSNASSVGHVGSLPPTPPPVPPPIPPPTPNTESPSSSGEVHNA